MHQALQSGLIFLTSSLLSGGAAFAFQSDAEKIQKHLEAIKARGEPTSVEELETSFPLPQGVENVAAIWEEGFAAINSREYRDALVRTSAKNLPFVGAAKKEDYPIADQPWPKLQEGIEFLKTTARPLERFHEASRRGGKCRFPLNVKDGFPTYAAAQYGSEAIRLLNLELEVRLQQNDARGAANAVRTMLSLPLCAECDFSGIAYARSCALTGIATDAAAKSLPRVQFTSEEIDSFRSVLKTISPQGTMRLTFLGDRAIGISALSPSDEEKDSVGARKLADTRLLEFLETTNRLQSLLSKPFKESIIGTNGLYFGLQKNIQSKESADRLMPSLGSAAKMSTLPTLVVKQIRLTQAADIGLAVELYRRRHNQLPDSLESLVPDFIAALPIDPISEKSMEWKVTEKGYEIFGTGMINFDDNDKPVVTEKTEGLFFPTKTK